MRVEIKATDLTDVDVERVSMVKHAANRTPFKLFKSAGKEGGVLDLSKLFVKTKKSADAWNANQGGGAVDAQEALEQAKAILERAGFTVAIATDGGQKQGVPGAEQANATDDNMAQQQPTQQMGQPAAGGEDGDVTAGSPKGSDGAAGGQSGQGQVINLHFHSNGAPAVQQAKPQDGGNKPPMEQPQGKPTEGDDKNNMKGKPPMSDDKNKKPADQAVQKSDAEKAAEQAVEAAKAALQKAEELLKAAQKSSPAQGDVNNDGPNKEDLKGTGATDVSGVGVGDKEVVADDPAVQKGKTEGSSGPGGKETHNMLKKLDDVVAGLASLSKSIENGFKNFGGRIDKVEASVKKADAALRGTVNGDASGDDEGQGTRVRKSAGAPPPLDTGMSR